MRLVVYAAQYAQGAAGDEVIENLIEAANLIPDTCLVIKLHPKTAEKEAAEIARRAEILATGDVRVLKNQNIYRLMRASDLVVTQLSNVGLEAAVLGLPVLSVNLSGRDYVVDLFGIGIDERASSPEEIVAKIQSLLYDPAASASLADRQDRYFAENPMLRRLDAADRIADYIVARARADAAEDVSFVEIVERASAAGRREFPSVKNAALQLSAGGAEALAGKPIVLPTSKGAAALLL